jgi:hypothetical protein
MKSKSIFYYLRFKPRPTCTILQYCKTSLHALMNYQTDKEEIHHICVYETSKTVHNAPGDVRTPAETTIKTLRTTRPNIPFRIQGAPAQFSTRKPATPTQVLRCFPQSLQANTGIVPSTGHYLFLTYPFPRVTRQQSHYSKPRSLSYRKLL